MDAKTTINALGDRQNLSLKERLALAEKQAQPYIHGLLNGTVAAWPGMRLRKLADVKSVIDPKTGQVVKAGTPGELAFDFYGADSPRDDNYDLENRLSMQQAEGVGELASAATLVPALSRRIGKGVAQGMLAKRVSNAAKEISSPSGIEGSQAVIDAIAEKSTKQGAEVTGRQAAAIKNLVKDRAVADAVNFEQDAVNIGNKFAKPGVVEQVANRFAARKALGTVGADVLQKADGQLSQEDQPQPVVIPEPEIDGEVNDVSGLIKDDTQQKPEGNALLDVMAGRKQIKPYERKDSLLEKIAYTLFPEEGRQNKRNDETAYLQNEIARQGFVDPDTQARLADLSGDKRFGQSSALQEQQGNLQLRNSVAPALSPAALEKLLGTGSGSIDPRLLDRMTRQKDDSSLLEALLNGGGIQRPGQVQVAQPIVNIPRR